MLCLSDGEYLDREQLLCGSTYAGESLDISTPEGVGLMKPRIRMGVIIRESKLAIQTTNVRCGLVRRLRRDFIQRWEMSVYTRVYVTN